MNKKVVISKINPLFLNGIAHRGYHNATDTENGLRAFQNALDHNLAIEFDVHLTKDNKLLVCHDSDLLRTTGKKGIIEELTLKEIKEHYCLLDGEEVPTFKELLELINEQVPMVVELKAYKKNYFKLAKRLKKELANIHDKKNFILISFEPRCLIPFANKGFIRELLVCKEKKWVFKLRFLFESVDLDKAILKDADVMKYHKKHFINSWTIETEDDLNYVKPLCDTVTFQLLDYRKVIRKMSEK
jgi:Glycerophosphoryl diester phosphodiesterase